MPYALSGQSLADALSQSQKLAKQFGFGFSGAFVVGRSAAWANLASPAATMAIPSLFIGSPAHGLNRPRRREPLRRRPTRLRNSLPPSRQSRRPEPGTGPFENYQRLKSSMSLFLCMPIYIAKPAVRQKLNPRADSYRHVRCASGTRRARWGAPTRFRIRE